MSSLAAQLAQSASLNSALLTDRSRRRSTESYLFTGREADEHDLESIHSLGVNGFLQLVSLDRSLRTFEEVLFSEHAKITDRTLLSSEANAQLDTSIRSCLALLGPYLMETPTGKVLEWLVRRFRINEFNVEAVLSLFLPYHESPHFTKMLSILHIKQNSTWSFLLPFKSAAQNLPRITLVTEMLSNSDVARFVASLLPNALENGYSHRVLLAFNAACLHDFLLHIEPLDEGTIAYILPALLVPLQKKPPIKDAILGTYILLSALSQKCKIMAVAHNRILGIMAGCADQVSARQFTNAILSVCEPQVELESMPDATLTAIIHITDIEKELCGACTWIGIEKVMGPLLPGLVKRLDDERCLSLLESIIATPKVPLEVIQRSTALLTRSAIANSSSVTSTRRLLTIIQQRHPSVFHQSMDEVCEEDEIDREVIDQLRISLSVVQGIEERDNTGSKDWDNLVLASINADPKVRTAAVNGLLAALSQEDRPSSEMNSIHLALLSRIQDTNQAVVDALYSRPSTILPILSENADAFIDSLATVLSTPGFKPKRSLLRAHLTFLTSHFCPANPSCLERIFQQVTYPFLMFSKPRQHTADAVWDIISAHTQNNLGAHEWLSGCALIVKTEKSKSGLDNTETMSNINIAVSSQIAKNIFSSSNYPLHLDTLVTKLQDPNSHVKALSFLIARALLGQIPGGHQIDAACRVLDVVNLEDVTGIEDLPQGCKNIFEAINDVTIGKSIVAKPNSKNTLYWLQIAVISLVSTLGKPTNFVFNWLLASPHDDRYVELLRKVYRLANRIVSAPIVTAHILQLLFITLKGDALAFLAGIWLESAPASEENNLRTLALQHAAAYLQAHIAEDDDTDFQTILPSLLVALSSSDSNIRQGAMLCISQLHRLADAKFTTVYYFDTIYGKNTNQLQYLDQDDFKRYLGSLVEYQDHFNHDNEYINLFHQQHLNRSKTDKKRDSEYKRRILCFIASHINAFAFPLAQIALLKIINTISDSAKTHLLLPTVKASVIPIRTGTDNGLLTELATLAISCFDVSVAKDINAMDGEMWDIFISTLKCSLVPGAPPSLLLATSRALENGLFTELSLERKFALCDLLLDSGAQNVETYAACKRLLGNLVEEVSLIVHILNSLQPSPTSETPRATKRIKTTHTFENALPRLSLFVEVLVTKSLSGSLELISQLLETLNCVVQSVTTVQAEVSYIEQLLMSAVETAANKIVEVPNLSPSMIRLDILVELIRVADNPQTFHQALLLMANLARLAPDSVLHNVMPVFTFMGSNVFHRDDTYSLKVVQQTIDNIVPVMVSSLKRTHTQPLDLHIGSKDFLKVFTDAANHIPRHRRTSFFTHLVDVLGSEDFLSPVCMLLVDKVANKIVKQNSEDVESLLSLPSSILHHCPISLQTRALTDMLHECQRLADRIAQPEVILPTFLDVSLNESITATTMALLRRRAQALIIFVGVGLKPPTSGSIAPLRDEEDMGHLVSALISLAIRRSDTSPEGKINEISHAARSSLNKVLTVMSVSDFVNAVLSMLQSGEPMVQAGALDLFSGRLSDVSATARPQIVPVIVKIVGAIQGLLKSQANEPTLISAFGALRSIGLTLCAGEESILTEAVPLVVNAIKGRRLVPSAMAALSPLPAKLGPRIIPYFREIISQTVAILREITLAASEDAYSILQGLLLSIPTFWGPGELTEVIALYADHRASKSNVLSTPMLDLVKAIPKRVPTKIILPAMIDMWPSFKVSPQMDRIVAYFDLLSRVLRNATRETVLEKLRLLFQVFSESFEIASNGNTGVETQAIVAFKELVAKLNEAAFRPLFRRLYDWAFVNKTDDIARRVTFCRIYLTLLDFFKGLMNPYMSFLLNPLIDYLHSFGAGSSEIFWACIVEVITKSLAHDDGGFWRDDKQRQLTTPLIKQVPICIRFTSAAEGKLSLQNCLDALVDSVSDDTLLKAINLQVLMYTRSEDIGLRLFALSCSEKLWGAHGNKLIGFVAETATFIAECTEDENDMVVRESFKLKDAVESVAGNINGL